MRACYVVFAALLPVVATAQEVPAGYRTDDYRAPVPDTVPGATVVDAAQAFALWESGAAAFVDVLPQAPKPANLPDGTIWRDKPRDSIPGAVWLPNVGYGELAPLMDNYLAAGLSEVTDDDPDAPIVFFCLDDCWMSWNAAKRASENGFTHVYWFPQGTDGWGAAGYPLERVEPFPGHP